MILMDMVHAFMHTCTHAHLHAYLKTSKLENIHPSIQTYIPVINDAVANEDVTAGWSDTAGAVVRNLL